MKVFCVHIPNVVVNETTALYDTKWDITTAKLFMHILDEIKEVGQEQFSLELYSVENIIYLCIAADGAVVNMITAGLYAIDPAFEVKEIEDYTEDIDEHTEIAATEIRLIRSDIFPIEDYRPYAYDSFAPIVPELSKLPGSDRMLVQFVCKPVKETAWLHFDLFVRRACERAERCFRPMMWFKRDLSPKITERIRDKCGRKLYYVNMRIAALGQREENEPRDVVRKRLKRHIENVTGAFKTLNTINENGLRMTGVYYGTSAFQRFQRRARIAPFRLSTHELTTLWHPPRLGNIPNTAQVLFKKGAPPRNLPSNAEDPQISLFGQSNYRDMVSPFGIRRFDRRRHLYTVGKSGSGKSCLLQLLVKSDIDNGFGCAVLDPHGDLVDNLLKIIPQHRIKDVVLFDPSDTQHPPSFNPMSVTRPELKMRAAIGFLDVFKRVFGNDWSEKMDHVIRYAILALFSVSGASVISLRKLLADPEFRAKVVSKVEDESVRRFWQVEFESRRSELEDGVVARILNRLDQLLATDMIRNIIGQPMNLFNFREMMDSRKIVLMKVSKGILGNDNATLLGSLIIAKIYEAAMSRADIPESARQDFYFYVDEVQNFATDSFGEILSESRKYGLCLTFANQFLGQLPDAMRQTVFGNVANIIGFRAGGADAAVLAAEFKPRFVEGDFLNLGVRDFYIKMAINGETQEAFSGRTLEVEYPPEAENHVREVLQHSRSKYCLPVKQAVETIAMSEIGTAHAVNE